MMKNTVDDADDDDDVHPQDMCVQSNHYMPTLYTWMPHNDCGGYVKAADNVTLSLATLI